MPDNVGKAEKAAMMNHVVNGLKRECVRLDELAENAFGSYTDTSSFMSFKDDYQSTHDACFESSYQGKPESIKRRTVLAITTIKLDKNFDIKIHGGEQFIEQGYDEEKGMKFYKLYFHEEK